MGSGMCCVGWGGVGSGTFCCRLMYGNIRLVRDLTCVV